MSDEQLTFATDLLERIAIIQRAIDGIRDASARFWNPELNRPMPGFANRIGATSSDFTRGSNMRRDTLQVTMRLLAGSTGSGYRFEHEDKLNALYFIVLETFGASPKLYHPDNGEALRYVESARITGSIGTVGFQFSEGSAPVFGTDFTLQVIANFQVRRKV